MPSASNAPVSNIVVQLVELGLDNWIQACEVASLVIQTAGKSEPNAVRSIALQVIRHVLESELMEVGDVDGTAFKRWNNTLEVNIARIEANWPLDSRPSLGDVCWLSNTAHGDAHAKTALSDGLHYAS